MYEFDGKPGRIGFTPVTVTERAEERLEDVQRDIYESHRHRTFSIAYYMTGNEIEAEDILTDTFVDAFRATPKPQGEDVDQSLVGQLRERFPLGEEPIEAPKTNPADPAPQLSGSVRRTDLEEAVQTLPSTERLVFLMRDVEGYQPGQVAKLLEMTEQQVNRTLFFARMRMRQALAKAQSDRQSAA
ncbi:RNA polymerase sigma factor [Silvibacterium acidisoli]|uniref:RNA polymerase sigma factor n=1 Tax=Acidobacteriaceae bacterium ZG23-2 TaxID=2883246 RepID=UPI00406CF67A